MIPLKGRKIDEFGQVIFDEEGLCEVLMCGGIIEDLVAEQSPAIQQFNQLYKAWDNGERAVTPYSALQTDPSEFHKHKQETWLMPASYKTLDVKELLFERCSTTEEIERVIYEFDLFTDRGMIPLLQFLVFLVDYLISNDIVYGVGRGSSVSSYCLYLIGVHRIDSLKYGLDIRDFLK